MKSTIILAQTGCLLPFLIAFNFAFGWIFLGVRYWLLTGLILILLFILTSYLMTRRIFRNPRHTEGVIDVEGHIVEDKDKRRLK